MTPTPEQIAAKLTEAQKRALRDPNRCAWRDYRSMELLEYRLGVCIFAKYPERELTAIGDAVLAGLDGGAK